MKCAQQFHDGRSQPVRVNDGLSGRKLRNKQHGNPVRSAILIPSLSRAVNNVIKKGEHALFYILKTLNPPPRASLGARPAHKPTLPD